jgi:hypothetical protein
VNLTQVRFHITQELDDFGLFDPAFKLLTVVYLAVPPPGLLVLLVELGLPRPRVSMLYVQYMEGTSGYSTWNSDKHT